MPYNVGLETIFTKFLWKKKKLTFLSTFYIFYKISFKIFLKWSINKYPKAPVIKTH